MIPGEALDSRTFAGRAPGQADFVSTLPTLERPRRQSRGRQRGRGCLLWNGLHQVERGGGAKNGEVKRYSTKTVHSDSGTRVQTEAQTNVHGRDQTFFRSQR